MIISEIVENNKVIEDDENFINLKYGNLNVIIDYDLGFFNATKFCSTVNSEKLLLNFIKLPETKTFILQLEKYYNTFVWKTKDETLSLPPPVSGIYFHPILFLKLAIWLSEKFYVQVACVINQFFNKSAERKLKLQKLLNLQDSSLQIVETISYKEKNGEIKKYRKINYDAAAGFELYIDGDYWFNASKFCDKYSKLNLYKLFERQNYTKKLFDYLKKKVFNNKHEAFKESITKDKINVLYGKRYHPILFLRLAIEIDDLEFYIKVSSIVLAHFNRNFETLEFLREKEDKKLAAAAENVYEEIDYNAISYDNNKNNTEDNDYEVICNNNLYNNENTKESLCLSSFEEEYDNFLSVQMTAAAAAAAAAAKENEEIVNNINYVVEQNFEYKIKLIMMRHQLELKQLERRKNREFEEEKEKLLQKERELLQEKNLTIELLTNKLENLTLAIQEERIIRTRGKKNFKISRK